MRRRIGRRERRRGGNGEGGGEGTRDIITCYSLSEASKVVVEANEF